MTHDYNHATRGDIGNLPSSMLDARLLADYVARGNAYDLSELCTKADISLRQVAQICVARGLETVDKLPGYAVTSEIYELAENVYGVGETRRKWLKIRNRHKHEYLESRVSREDLKVMLTDRSKEMRYFARIYFAAWAVFWDDRFVIRMIDKVDSRIIESIPNELLNEEICFAAVTRSGLALRYVPETLRSLPVCARAVEKDPAALAFVPSRLRNQVGSLHSSDFD